MSTIRKLAGARAASAVLAAFVGGAIGTIVAAPAQAAPVAASGSAARPDADRRYYAAAMAAAGASLQLHEVAAARHWLDEAPASLRGWEWSYLSREADRSERSVAASSRPVTDLAASPDGSLLAACAGNDVLLLDARTGDAVAALSGHAKPAWNARFSPDGARLASVASDGTLRVWDVVARAEVLLVEDAGQGVAAVAWRPDGAELCTASWRRAEGRGVYGVIDTWDAATGAHRRHLEHGVKPIGAVNYEPGGRRIWLGSWDYDLAAYDVNSGEPGPRVFPAEDGAYKRVNECRLSPDGARVAAAHDDGVLRVWGTASGALELSLHRQAEGARLPLSDFAWLAGGRRLATASSDLTVRLWDAASGDHLATLHGHTAAVTALAALPDGSALWSGDADGALRRWDLGSLATSRTRWELEGSAYGIALDRSGRRAAVTGWGGWVAVHDAPTGERLARWDGHGESGVRTAWSPDDALLATTGNDGLLRLWDMRHEPPRLVREHRLGVQGIAVAFSADGRWLAAPVAGPGLGIWSVADGTDAGSLEDGVAFSDVAWHPGRPLLAACGHDGAVRLRDQSDGTIIARLEGHGGGALQAAFSPDGSLLATASAAGEVAVWETANWTRRLVMATPGGGQLAVAFSPDGSRLATCGADDRVHVWDPLTGAHLLAAPLADSPYDLTWTPDGRRLFVLPLDRTLRVLE